MIRFLVSLYFAGIVIVLVLLLIFVPNIPFVDAIVGAVLWPWGVYRHFIQGT
jgi:hypothetical protein